MGSPAVVDFEKIAAPIVGPSPTGQDLRENRAAGDPYDLIRTARKQATVREREQLAGSPYAPATVFKEWKTVQTLGTSVLAEKSKDLEIVAYLLEAQVRLNGFAGLRDGFRLARALIEQYWDSLYPPAGDDGTGRQSFFRSLNGEDREGALILPIYRVPLTGGGGPVAGRYEYQLAVDAEGLDPAKREERITAGMLSLEAIKKESAASPDAFYAALNGDLSECIDEFGKLGSAFEEKCGADAPPSSMIRTALDNCREVIASLTQGRVAADAGADAAGEGSSAGSGDAAGASKGTRVAGVVSNRAQAFDTILRVAQFFRETEPQSPICFALEQVVRWGRMPLPELLTELITDEGARQNLFKMVGITPPPPEASSS